MSDVRLRRSGRRRQGSLSGCRARGALGLRATAYATAKPTLILEVLAPSTIEVDLGAKAREYLGLPSVQAYIAVSQERPVAHAWVRQNGSFPAGPVPVLGWEAAIAVPQLGLTLPLAPLYRGIGARPDATASA